MQHTKPSTSAANDSERFDKIKSLNLKKLNWQIRAKVTESTGAIPSASGTRYIRVTFEDDSGKINAVAFGKNADKFEPLLTQDQTVKVSGAKLEKCEKKYATFHKCKMLLLPITDIVPCNDATFTTTYKSFTALQKMGHKMITNCIGIIVDIGELEMKSGTKTDGKYVAFRKLTLVDDQKKPIELALWNEHAQSFCGKLQDVLAVKDFEVKVYKGNRQFSTLSLSKLDLNPDCFEAGVLRQKNNNAVPVTDTPSPVKHILTPTPEETESSSPERKKQKTDWKEVPAWVDSVIDTEKCNHKLTDLEAVKFPETLGDNWRNLDGWLGLDNTYIQRLRQANPNEIEVQIKKMLHEWRRRKNEKATLKELLVILKKCSGKICINWKLIKEKIIDAL